MQPEFTDYEQYLVSYYKSGQGGTYGEILNEEFPSLVATLVMMGLGLYVDSTLFMGCALFVYIVVKMREALGQPKGREALKGVVQKYEARIAELEQKLREGAAA